MFTDKKSFEFFDWLFEYNRYDELKNVFISDYLESVGQPREINFQEGIIDDRNEIYSFNHILKTKCIENQKLIENDISIFIKNDLVTNSEKLVALPEKLNQYLIFSKVLYPQCKFLEDIFNQLISLSKRLTDSIISQNKELQFGTNNLSFHWLGTSSELQNFYTLLTSIPKILDADFDDFKSAFTENSINNGLKWLPKGKNQKISKTLLFYFIEEMQEHYLIAGIPDDRLYQTIQYVFRDSDGSELKNLKQSNYNWNNEPFGSERINEIFNEFY